jgi:hypothetical protein
VAWCVVIDYTMKIPKSCINKEYQTVKILTNQVVFAQSDGWRYKHVAGFGAIHYQNTPKLEAVLNAK